jgi:hypothetical protein
LAEGVTRDQTEGAFRDAGIGGAFLQDVADVVRGDGVGETGADERRGAGGGVVGVVGAQTLLEIFAVERRADFEEIAKLAADVGADVFELVRVEREAQPGRGS